MNKLWLVGLFVAALGTDATLATQPVMQGAAPGETTALGSVRLTRQVSANGQTLAAGTYEVRITTTESQPVAAGQSPSLERWAEFVQNGQVKGREVASIIPDSDMSQVAEGARPRPGGSKVELLKGGDYLRVWINRGGNHYLIHLPT